MASVARPEDRREHAHRMDVLNEGVARTSCRKGAYEEPAIIVETDELLLTRASILRSVDTLTIPIQKPPGLSRVHAVAIRDG